MNVIIKDVKIWFNTFIKQNNLSNNKIRKPKKNMINILLLYGDDEIQKEVIIMSIFKDIKDYQLCYLTQDKLELLFTEKENNYTSFLYTYFNQLSLNNNKKKIMIINENKIYNFHKYKNIIINIVNVNNNIYPIILILNSSHRKFLNILKKKTKSIYINNLSGVDIKNYLIFKLKEEKIIDKTNNKFIEDIIKYSDYNLNKVNTLLYDLIYTYCDNKTITISSLNNFNNNILMNNCKDTIINTNYKLLTTFNGLNKSYELFNHDRINNPLVMEEQYINKIIQYENDYKNDKDKMKYLNNITLKISNSFIYSNLYDTYIYNYQKWDLIKIHGFFSCSLPSYYLSLLQTKHYFSPFITFAIDMNRTSIQKMNTKHIYTIYENINLIDIKYYIYLNEIIYYLLKHSSNNTLNINKIKLTNILKDIIKTYNLNMSLIEKILKINKLSNNEIKLSKKLYNYLFLQEN